MDGGDFAPLLTLTAALFAGLAIGSFLNVVIHRGPTMWSLVDGEPRGDLVSPRSYCPACRTPIPSWRLVPVVSFLVQRGRCAACGAPISPRYPAVELLGGLVPVAALAAFGPTSSALAASAFGFALIALAFIDLETGYLPDAITLPLVACGLVANGFGLFVAPADAAIGAAAGYLALRAVAFAFEGLRGKEGLGRGDAKLLAAIGAWAGWQVLPFVVFAAAAATLAGFGVARLAGRKAGLEEAIPFGPGLCAAGFAILALSAIQGAV